MPESAEILALVVARGYLRASDTAELLGVTRQRVSHLARRADFPAPVSVATSE